MTKICSWCKKEMPDEAGMGEDVSHGICPECEARMSSGLEGDLKVFIDGIDLPVLIINDTGTVDSANKKALGFLDKNFREIEGEPGGDVFQCKYADTPEGCGATLHCVECTIRMLVMETFETGNAYILEPALLHREDSDISFLISTVKSGDFVLLKIDEVTGIKKL